MSGWQPTCPKCGELQGIEATRCADCGYLNLYPTEHDVAVLRDAAKSAKVLPTPPPVRKRFVVRELVGYPIGGARRPALGPLLSCSVHDSALYGGPLVAIFNEEDDRGNQHRSSREAIRRRASGLAAILEAEHAQP